MDSVSRHISIHDREWVRQIQMCTICGVESRFPRKLEPINDRSAMHDVLPSESGYCWAGASGDAPVVPLPSGVDVLVEEGVDAVHCIHSLSGPKLM